MGYMPHILLRSLTNGGKVSQVQLQENSLFSVSLCLQFLNGSIGLVLTARGHVDLRIVLKQRLLDVSITRRQLMLKFTLIVSLPIPTFPPRQDKGVKAMAYSIVA